VGTTGFHRFDATDSSTCIIDSEIVKTLRQHRTGLIWPIECGRGGRQRLATPGGVVLAITPRSNPESR